MFSLMSNTMCNNALFNPRKLRGMTNDQHHPSFIRLLDASKEHGVTGHAALAKALEQSEQTITNWASRGVSKPGAIKAQKVFGCSVNWVLSGTGPQQMAESETVEVSPSIAELIKRLSIALQTAPLSTQGMAADAFARWARHPHRWGELIEQLELLNLDLGKVEPDPRFVLTTTSFGERAAKVSEDALRFAEEFTELSGRIEAESIFSDVYIALGDAKRRHGVGPTTKADSPPMTTAARLRLRESASHGSQPKE